MSPESAALRQWTPVISSWMDWNANWLHCPRTTQKFHFSQLPNRHGTTWAVMSTAQLADYFWECNGWKSGLSIVIWDWNRHIFRSFHCTQNQKLVQFHHKHLVIYCHMPAGWGLQQTIQGSRQRQDTGPGILKIKKKNRPYTRSVLLWQGEPGTSHYIHHYNNVRL